jgi:prevent-host-death family protein
MGESVNVYEAKTNFSRLVARAEAGEEIVISRHGRPVARLAPLVRAPAQRRPGAWAGRFVVPDDFDDFDEQDASDWYGP